MNSEPENSSSSLMFAIVCFGLSQSNITKQPWHTVLGIARGLAENGARVVILTDCVDPPDGTYFEVESVRSLCGRHGPTAELSAALRAYNPARVIYIGGVHELLRYRRFHFDYPVSLVIANQRFRLSEWKRLRPMDWLTEYELIISPFIQSLLPAWIIRRCLLKAGVAHLIYFSYQASRRYAEMGLAPGTVVRPRVGMDMIPSGGGGQKRKKEGVTRYGYFGPPLALRGVEEVIEGFVEAYTDNSGGELVLYLRVDDELTARRTSRLKRMISAIRPEIRQRISIVDESLGLEQLKSKLEAVDVYVLPFKITVSDVPLVVIEAAMSGKPVIVFDTPGVSDWSTFFPNLLVCSRRSLPDSFLSAANVPSISSDNAGEWNSWQEATQELFELGRNGLDLASLSRFDLICLIGVDGSGKTALINCMSEHLGIMGCQHSYIWSRFRNYVSKPFLGLMRVIGLNKKVVIKGNRIGIHKFKGRPLISRIFLFLQKIDMNLDLHFRYRPRVRRGLVLGDRCPLDTLVDLVVDTGMKREIFSRYGEKVRASLPDNSLVVLVERDARQVIIDRPDVESDPHYHERRLLYREMADKFGIPILNNSGTLREALVKLNNLSEVC